MGERAAPARRWGGTVRLRITVVAAVAVLAVLVIAGVALVVEQRRSLVEQLDESLEADVAQVLANVPDGTAATDVVVLAPVGDDDAVAQVVTLDGRVVASTANVAGRAPIAAAPEDDGAARTVDELDDEPFRLVSRRIDDAALGAVVVHVASPLDDIDESIADLTRTLALLVPLVTALLGAVVFVLVGRTLRPVEAIRAEVAAIGPDELDRRVPRPPGRDEIARLAVTMNGMLDRLERAHRRQQQFVADASHELRTPLARMRTELEVDQRHPDTADPATTVSSVLDEIEHLQRLIDDLLVLARSDAGGPTTRDRIGLDALVLDELGAADDPDIAIDRDGVRHVRVRGDAAALRRVVRNVLDNAVRHAAALVTVTLVAEGGEALLTITDDGPGIPADRVDAVFERFATLDDARTPGRGGTGLGLAIARAIVRDHGGTIAVDPEGGPGATVVVRLPVADAPLGPAGEP